MPVDHHYAQLPVAGRLAAWVEQLRTLDARRATGRIPPLVGEGPPAGSPASRQHRRGAHLADRVQMLAHPANLCPVLHIERLPAMPGWTDELVPLSSGLSAVSRLVNAP